MKKQKNHLENDNTLIRLPQVLALVPVSRATWWKGVKDGRYPQPIKLGPRTTAWRKKDIMQLVEHGIS